jgi:hypothetical protein
MKATRLPATVAGVAAQTPLSRPIPAVTLSNENGPNRSGPRPHPPTATSGGHTPAMGHGEAAARQWPGRGG